LSSSATAPVPEQPDKQDGYYLIGEVSRLANLKPFVLRFWEEEFPMLQPFKSPSGRRLYRQDDVDLVLKIRRLLYDEGFTIAGARRFLLDTASGNAEPGANGNAALPSSDSPTSQLNRKMLLDLRDSLRSFLTLLERK
jgi:DNA-binding transcriptional MerR regulator